MSPINKPLHVLSSEQFDRKSLDHICELTNTIRKYDKTREGLLYLQSLLPHKRAMLYFSQPSTRTFLSFQSACQVLGIKPNEIRDSATSSELKGESIEDSLRTFSSYVDLVIMRTAIPGLCDRIAKTLDNTPRPVPIINAGSGPDQHPTQAILDIYTLNRSFDKAGGIEGKTIMMVGDVKRGRTVRSLSLLLTNYRNVRLIFSSPEAYKIEDDLRQKLRQQDVDFEETTAFESALSSADAVYMTRIQDEYDLKKMSPSDKESQKKIYKSYHLRNNHLKLLKPKCVIMHPLPRRDELDPLIDGDPRAKYWRQERNGMWTRAALMTMVLGVDHQILLPSL
jgi:aspartate carbamoyltransferase catalytic subunit